MIYRNTLALCIIATFIFCGTTSYASSSKDCPDELDKCRNKNLNLKREVNELKMERDRLKADVDGMHSRKNDYRSKYNEMKTERDLLLRRNDELKREIDSLLARHRTVTPPSTYIIK